MSTAGVAAMPLLTGNEVVSDAGATTDCHPAASLNYPEGQSKPEYVVPVYETGFGVGIDAVLTGWCHDGGRMLSDPKVTVNVIDGGTVSSYLIPRFKVELDPEIGGGEQNAFVPTDLLVKAVRDATGDAAWEVGSRLFSLTYTSGTFSATTGMFSFVKQDPDVVNPSSPEPTPEPTSEPTTGPTQEPTPEPSTEPTQEPSAEPTTEPTVEPTAEPTTEPTTEPTAEPTVEPTQEPSEEPSPTPSPSSSPEPTPTAAPTESARPDPAPTPSAGPTPSTTPTNETCAPKPTVTVLNPDGSDPRNGDPAYQPEHSIRVSGSGWCENGAAIDGDRTIEVKLVVYSGYVVPRTASVPVTFSNGAFSAQLALSSLYAGTDLATNRYYLQISPMGSAQSGVTNIFSYEAPAAPEPTPAPTPTAVPTPTPTRKPTAEPSASASPSPTRSADPTPVPSPTPSTEPGPEPSASPLPSTGPSAAPSAQPTQSARPAPTSDHATTSPDGAHPGRRGNTSNTGSDTGGPSNDAGGNGPGGGGARNASGTGTSETGSSPAGAPAQSGADRTRTQNGARDDDAAPSDSQDPEPSVQASAEASASEDRTARPDRNPVPPVTSAAQLSADNAGSLSGSRQGNIVNLVLPKAKASAGEWVSVFVFPGATTKGWVQVDEANSVSIDISSFESGSYELAVADRDNSLLGWAKLEITSASFDPRSPAQAQLLTFPDKDAPTSMGLSANDMLLGGAGGLLVIGAGSLLVAARSGLPLRAPRVLRRLRILRRR
ncbi:hypothetical protein [Actinomyces viscosus]|uniref:hypothetical protein n=1 Tax=Actinomyces viscosus TaxID=1656 RepID=UPI0028E8104C|nr:hypothetical protein [Actinomyces viscosus]